jgi:hypothetical protein
MAIERAVSRFAALRNPYCLLVEEGTSREMPDLLRPYYRRPWTVELRVLYKDGEEFRRQWIFRDGARNRLTAVFTRLGEDTGTGEGAAGAEDAGAEEGAAGDGSGGEGEPGRPLGFIESYGEHGLIVMEREFLEDEELIIDYVYRASGGREVLIRADARRRSFGKAASGEPDSGEAASGELDSGEPDSREAAPEESASGEPVLIYSDYYRYTRNYSLRLIERVFPRPPENEGGLALLRFPRRSLDSERETGFVSPVPVYGSRFLEDLRAETLQRIVYTTDERGRILTERREDGEGNIVGELRNTWSGDRLSRIVWSADGEERVTEYEYNREGDRIEERNYQNGVLERLVRVRGDREEEELYMDGELVLRAFWEGGRKIREEPVRPGERSRRRGNP